MAKDEIIRLTTPIIGADVLNVMLAPEARDNHAFYYTNKDIENGEIRFYCQDPQFTKDLRNGDVCKILLYKITQRSATYVKAWMTYDQVINSNKQKNELVKDILDSLEVKLSFK